MIINHYSIKLAWPNLHKALTYTMVMDVGASDWLKYLVGWSSLQIFGYWMFQLLVFLDILPFIHLKSQSLADVWK